MTIEQLFEGAENGTLTLEQFKAAVKSNNAKFVDINEGNYVSKHKYDDDIKGLNNQIETLNSTITQRDGDLEQLRKDLEAAGTNQESLQALQTSFTDLQGKYDADTKAYKSQLKKQAYEFAVKEFASGKKFTSQAAKRDFINSMITKDLKMEGDKILGAEDFVTAYSADNADAFVVETPPDPEPNPKPTFVNPTPGGQPNEVNGFTSAFHFTGVRPIPNQGGNN